MWCGWPCRERHIRDTQRPQRHFRGISHGPGRCPVRGSVAEPASYPETGPMTGSVAQPVPARSVLVTGGTGGLGGAVTQAFVEAGWRTVVAYRSKPPEGVVAIRADLAEPGSV